MPSNDIILTDRNCHDPIWNGLQEAVNGLDPANVLAVFRAVIAAVTIEFIKAEALIEDICEFIVARISSQREVVNERSFIALHE